MINKQPVCNCCMHLEPPPLISSRQLLMEQRWPAAAGADVTSSADRQLTIYNSNSNHVGLSVLLLHINGLYQRPIATVLVLGNHTILYYYQFSVIVLNPSQVNVLSRINKSTVYAKPKLILLPTRTYHTKQILHNKRITSPVSTVKKKLQMEKSTTNQSSQLVLHAHSWIFVFFGALIKSLINLTTRGDSLQIDHRGGMLKLNFLPRRRGRRRRRRRREFSTSLQ